MSTVSTEKPVPGGKDVLVEFEDGIAWVSLNRPQKRNAMSADLAFEMLSVLEALEIDERAGVLVLTGTGEAFSAGMDLKDYFRKTDGMPVLDRLKVYRTNALWQWRLLAPYPKPTIAMVNGWCFGGAFTPLISCDLAIAAEDAVFGLSEINWGIIPAGIVTKAVEQVMNQRDCLYYIMTGETFDGKRAKEMGLVNDRGSERSTAQTHAQARAHAAREKSGRAARYKASLQARAAYELGTSRRLSRFENGSSVGARSQRRPRGGHEAIPRR